MKLLIKKIVPRRLINIGLKIITFFAIIIHSIKFTPLIIRKDTTDSNTFTDIFVLNRLVLPIKINPELIIDAGAYTGFSTLYYSSMYPSAKIIAIEPENSNFEILEKHTKRLPNITRIKSGLWCKNTFLKIVNESAEKHSFIVKEVSESDNYDIKAITIDDILKKSGFDKIDILKLNIEGSEKEVFSKNYDSWMNKVNVMIVYLHDRIINGCTDSLYSAINRNEWKEYKEIGKVTLIRKKIII